MNTLLDNNLCKQILSKMQSDINTKFSIACGMPNFIEPSRRFLFNKLPYNTVVPLTKIKEMHTSDTPSYTIKAEDAMVMQLRLRRLYMSFCPNTRLESYGLKYVSFSCSHRPKILNAVTDLKISNGGSLVVIVINDNIFTFLIDADITELPDDVTPEAYRYDEELLSELNEFFMDYTGFDVYELLES